MAQPDNDDKEDSTAEPDFFKFPRTRHLLNLGAATRDDLLLHPKDAEAFLAYPSAHPSTTLILEEKIDGANLGLSIDPTSFTVKAQNRSHFVNSQSHTQFKKLDKWIEDHSQELWQVLCPDDDHPPGRLILFGEWMFAKHSIHYTRLPDYFMAFDLYDTHTCQFYSRKRMAAQLFDTSIAMISCLHMGTPATLDSMRQFVITAHSQYYDGIVEGLYVRLEDENFVLQRAKVVRSDFIAQPDQHWTRSEILANKLAY